MSPPPARWPLFNISLRQGDVRLRVANEGDLEELAASLPDDAERDPSSSMLTGLDLDGNRRRLVLQGYWSRWATWSPESWDLLFVVAHRGRLAGVQSLQASGFPALRTVDSGSWLVPGARGVGTGKVMRAAVLALAFEHLAAEAAISSARSDNDASLGVSRSLGYEANGVSVTASPTGPCVLSHVRLTAVQWRAGKWADRTEVRGLEGCEPYFALDRFGVREASGKSS
ncbi:MAG: GNAT family N-acetyltransferase [Acidimicrobiales bacterium]